MSESAPQPPLLPEIPPVIPAYAGEVIGSIDFGNGQIATYVTGSSGALHVLNAHRIPDAVRALPAGEAVPAESAAEPEPTPLKARGVASDSTGYAALQQAAEDRGAHGVTDLKVTGDYL